MLYNRVILLLVLIVICLSVNVLAESIISRDAYSDTFISDGTFKTVFYPNQVNVNFEGDFIPIEEYISVNQDGGIISVSDLKGDYCNIIPNYNNKLTDTISTINPINIDPIALDPLEQPVETLIGAKPIEIALDPKLNINLVKNKGSYYFTTNYAETITDVSYYFDCSETPIFKENVLKFGEISIDFNQAKKEQNISTSFDSAKSQLDFGIVEGKTGSLNLIDPVISYNTSTSFKNNQVIIYDSGFASFSIPTTLPPTNGDYYLLSDTGYLRESIRGDGQVWGVPFGNYGYEIYNITFNLSMSNPKINFLNWSWTGKGTDDCSQGTNIVGYVWNFTGQNWSSCFTTSSTVLVNLSCNIFQSSDFIRNNNFYFLVYASQAGGCGQTIGIDYTQFDIDYDGIIISSPLSNSVNNTGLSMLLNITVSSYNYTNWYTLNGGLLNTTLCAGPATCIANQTIFTVPRNDSYTLTVYGNKSDGTQISASVTNLSFGVLSNQAPYIINTLANTTNSSNINVNFTYNISDDNNYLSNISLMLDGLRNMTIFNVLITPNTNNTAYFNLNVSEGSHNWSIQATDSNGVQANSTNFKLTIDLTQPLVTILTPTNTTYRDLYSYNLSLNVSGSDSGSGISKYKWTLDSGATNTTFATNKTSLTISPGSNTLTVYANDSAGNENYTTVTFYESFTPKITSINISNLSTSYSTDSFWDGLVLYLPFEENRSDLFIDKSGNNRIATVGGPVHTTGGVIGNSLSLDGKRFYNSTLPGNQGTGSALTVPTTSLINISYQNNFSLTYWFKTNDTQMPANNIGGIGYSFGFSTMLKNGYVKAGTRNGSTINEVGTIAGTYADNYWHFVAVTYNSSSQNLTLYTDNNSARAVNCVNDLSIGSASLLIGNAVYGGNSQTFNGSFDEVRMYNRTLNPTEVSSLYFLVYPVFQESANVTINVTITDEDTPQSSIYYSWFVNGVQALTGFAQNVFNYIFNLQNQNVQVVVNDTSGYNASNSFNISTTFIIPQITISYPLNNTNTSNTQLQVNYTATDVNRQACWYSRDSGSTNTTLANCINITGITWNEGLNNISIFVNDSVGNVNYSSVTFNLDTTGPTVTIINPLLSQSFPYNNISINYTVSDSNIGIDSCWYHVDSGVNVTLLNCDNTTYNASEGPHTLYLYANDSLNNINRDVHTFLISTTGPAINLDYPLNNTFFNSPQDIFLNWTATKTGGISSCQVWGDFNGTFSRNLTKTQINSGVQNYTVYNLSEGRFNWNVWCNDSLNVAKTALSNFTFTVDTTYPNTSIGAISTTVGSQTVLFGFNTTDLNIKNCWYNVQNSSSGYDLGNSTLDCSLNSKSITVTGYNSYVLFIYANDSAGNINYSSKAFITTASSGLIQQTGSGGTEIIVVISGNLSWQMYTENRASKSYELIMNKISNRKIKNVYFKNSAETPVDLAISCEDIQGDICKYVTISKSTLTLPPSSVLETQINFEVFIPSAIPDGEYIFNVLAEDQNKGQGRLAVKVNYGKMNIFTDTLGKLFGGKTKIGKMFFYNFFIVGFFSIVAFSFVFVIFKKNKKTGPLIAIFSAMLIGLVILILL